jgi:hypothetical protein
MMMVVMMLSRCERLIGRRRVSYDALNVLERCGARSSILIQPMMMVMMMTRKMLATRYMVKGAFAARRGRGNKRTGDGDAGAP